MRLALFSLILIASAAVGVLGVLYLIFGGHGVGLVTAAVIGFSGFRVLGLSLGIWCSGTMAVDPAATGLFLFAAASVFGASRLFAEWGGAVGSQGIILVVAASLIGLGAGIARCDRAAISLPE